MQTTKQDIRRWLEDAKLEDATHLIVVCDTYDYEDYPVSVMPNEDVHKKYTYYSTQGMSKVMEVYNLNMDLESQLAERRAFHF
jgi:hypothetical protein